MANNKGKSTKKDILSEEFATALVRALQRDDNYERFVGGRDTGPVTFLEAGDGATRIIIDLGKS